MTKKDKDWTYEPYEFRPIGYDEAFHILYQLYTGYGELVTAKKKFPDTKNLNKFLNAKKILLELFREIDK